MAKFFDGKYPVVFIHGMFGWGEGEGINSVVPYWGATTGDLVEWLNDNGCRSYSVSVGPMSSAWDQACEIYAQLTGTRVDYGEAHAKQYNHKRFGREHKTALVPDWSAENKIHFIGHSFGGNSIRMLAHLLEYGAPEEVEASGENVSPLFKGGNGALVCSVTTICSPLNGTAAYETAERFRILPFMKALAYTYSALLGRSPLNGFVDFHLEQFGMSRVPGEKESDSFFASIKKFNKSNDCIDYDMSPDGAKKLNERIKTSPSAFYFSYQYNAVKQYKNTNHYVPSECDFPFMILTSSLMMINDKIDKSFKSKMPENANDGLVNVSSASFPVGEEHTVYDKNGTLSEGVWNVMPSRIGDHGTPIGLFADRLQTRAFYLKHLDILAKTEKEL